MSSPTTVVAGKRTKGGVPLAVTVVVILAVLSFGGWCVWKFWQGLQMANHGAVVVLDEKPSEYGRLGGGQLGLRRLINQQNAAQRLEAELNGPDYVRPRGANGWEAKGNHTRLTITRAGAKLRFSADSLEPNFVTADQRSAFNVRNRAVAEDAVARQINLTPDQRKELNQVVRSFGFPIDEPTRTKLETLFLTWEKANTPANATALTAAVRELETAQAQLTRKSIADRTARIKTILSDEQIKLFENMGRAR